MALSVVQKIINAHLVSGTPVAGNEVGIRIDQTLTQDATGTMAYLQFEAMGYDSVKTELSVSYVDHNTIQEGFENADDHYYLERVARKFGIFFSRAGNGICHQVHLERFGIPGKTLLGSDSHTPTGGGITMLAIGAGGLDVAVAMGGGAFNLTYPKVLKINLSGKLKPWVSAKDVILKVLELLSTKGNVGWVVEYAGPGVATLSVPERATITNMGAELGVTSSVFPSDEKTRQFLTAQGRGKSFKTLVADSDAVYDKEINIDLSSLEPMIACPHSPGNVKKVKELKGTKVDQVCIGSCTNSSFRDMMIVAKLLKGRTIAKDLSFGISCGSRQVLEMIARNGALGDIVGAGARILESACGFCIGNSMAPKSEGVSVRTSNRNFFGRSGTTTALVYLVSPEVAVAAALAGEIVDPRKYFSKKPFPKFVMPKKFLLDDTMIVHAKADPKTTIVRGPNIGTPPLNDQCPQSIVGEVTIYLGDKITTDDIMPAGNRLKYRSNIPKYAEFVFERQDPQFAARALENKARGVHNIIVAGESYGQGSSREHAAICPMHLGVKMVIARSIERIHHANLVNFGVVPATFVNADDYTNVKAGDKIVCEKFVTHLKNAQPIIVCNSTTGVSFPVIVELSGRQRDILLAGGLINQTRQGK